MTKQIYKLLPLATLVSACASPNDLRSAGPALQFKSPHEARDVAACIADQWTHGFPFGTSDVNVKPLRKGYSVALGNDGHTGLLADIEDSPSGGSTTRLYKFSSLSIKRYDDAVTNCQNEQKS